MHWNSERSVADVRNTLFWCQGKFEQKNADNFAGVEFSYVGFVLKDYLAAAYRWPTDVQSITLKNAET